MSDRSQHVAVIGAGVAGLATASNLELEAGKRGCPLRISIFESAAEIGGHLRTIRQEGYSVEIGPNGFLDNEPATLRLVNRLNLDADLQRSTDACRHRFLLVGGRLRELPMSPPAFIMSRMLPISAKLRMACEVLIPARKDLGRAAIDPATDETVYDFGKRRLGKEFAEVMMDPMVKGIFGGDARRLSLAAAFPRMVELEQRYGGLFVALFKLSRERKRNGTASASPGPSGVLHSFSGGMAALPARLAETLAAEIHTACPITSIQRDQDQWQLVGPGKSWGPFAAVVNAAPAYAAASQIDDTKLSALLRGIPYAPMVVVTLAYDRDNVAHDLNGFGMLIPTRENTRLMGVLWSASIFTGRAPEGMVLLRCMAGGPGQDAFLEQTDEALLQMSVDELTTLYGLKGRPAKHWVIRHPKAIAQYEPGHLARLRAIEVALERLPGLFLTGNSYRGVSVNYCLKEAEIAAIRVVDFIGSRAGTGIKERG